MRRFVFAALAVLSIASAHAATGSVAISFTPPSAYTDGTPLPAASINSYQITCLFTPTGGVAGACGLNTVALPGGSSTGGVVSITYPAIGGQACFSLRTVAGVISSAASTPVCKTFAAVDLTPNPPSNVTVTVTLTLNLSSASPITVAAASPVVVVH